MYFFSNAYMAKPAVCLYLCNKLINCLFPRDKSETTESIVTTFNTQNDLEVSRCGINFGSKRSKGNVSKLESV